MLNPVGLITKIAEGATHEHGRTVAHVGRDHVRGKFRTLEVTQRSVHGVDKVLP
jgi:hypothetical protein